MKTSEIQKQLKKLNIDNHTKEAITTLIDIKTENDMREVIKEIGALKNVLENRITSLDNKFESKFNVLENAFESKFNVLENRITSLDNKFDNRISNFKWTVGITGIGLAIIGLIIKYG